MSSGRTAWRWGAALGSGVALWLPFADDRLAPLLIVAPLPWLLLLARPGEAPSILPVAFGGVTFMLLALGWIGRAGLPVLVMAASYYATSIVAFAWAYRRCAPVLGWPVACLAPILWGASEVARLVVYPFGVQWLNLGVPFGRFTPLVQVVEWLGVPAVTFVVMVTCGGVADAVLAWQDGGRPALARWRTWRGVAAGFALGAAFCAYGVTRMASADLSDGPTLALVQAAVPQDARHAERNVGAVFAQHVRLTRDVPLEGVAGVAWSESTLRVMLEDDPRWWNAVSALAREISRPLVVGAIGLGQYPDGSVAPTNSAFLVQPDGRRVARWDKRVLVPPAETLLWVDRVPALRRAVGTWLHEHFHFTPYLVPGREPVVTPLPGGLELGAMICYDDAVPWPSRELLDAGADVLLVLTNEAWFGATELGQHLNVARLRAIETRLPLLRSGNTGRTVAIDPLGRVHAELPADTPGVLLATAQRTALEAPPAWPAIAFRWALLAAAVALVVRCRHPREGEHHLRAEESEREARAPDVLVAAAAGAHGARPPSRRHDPPRRVNAGLRPGDSRRGPQGPTAHQAPRS